VIARPSKANSTAFGMEEPNEQKQISTYNPQDAHMYSVMLAKLLGICSGSS